MTNAKRDTNALPEMLETIHLALIPGYRLKSSDPQAPPSCCTIFDPDPRFRWIFRMGDA
jgi:hypothetical protein